MLNKEMAKLDWTRPAQFKSRGRCAGLNPWPCAETTFAGRPAEGLSGASRPIAFPTRSRATVIASGAKEGLIVACGEGWLELIEIQAPGAKRMAVRAYLLGKRIALGTRLGEQNERCASMNQDHENRRPHGDPSEKRDYPRRK